MVKTKNIVIIILIFFFFNACKEEPWPDRVPYYGSEIKTNGYYYCRRKNYYDVYFFYRDGVVLKFDVDTLSKTCIEKAYNHCQTFWNCWYTFYVNGNDLWIKQYKRRGLDGKEGWNYFAYIENDSTFQFLYSVDISGEKKRMNKICCFKEFYYKPDSSYSYNFF